MIFDSLHSDIMFNRVLLWAIMVRLTESRALAVMFVAMALWDVLAALMGVDE